MRVLYVIPGLSATGGAEQSLAALAPELVKRGVDLHIATLRPLKHDMPARAASWGVPLHQLTGRGPGIALGVRRLARDVHPDLVHTTLIDVDIPGRIGARLAGVPVVTSLVNESYGPQHLAAQNPWKVQAYHAADALTARLAIRMHSITGGVADMMSKRLIYPRQRIDVVYRGRDPARLGPRSALRREVVRASLGLGDRPTLLAVGRHEYQKDFVTLLRAIPHVRSAFPNALLLVAGRDGAATAELNRLVAELGLGESVRFLGVRTDAPDLMVASDVLAFPSIREGFGGVLAEAMALELPIVASNLPVIQEVVDGERIATLVPTQEPIALAQALVDVLKDPVAAAHRAQQGRALFLQRYTIDRVADGMVAFYERSLAEAGRRFIA